MTTFDGDSADRPGRPRAAALYCSLAGRAMARIHRALRQQAGGDGGRGAATLSIATILGQAVQFLGSLVLTSLYTPPEFGVFAVFLAITILLLPVVCFRYEWAIPIAPSDEEARALLGLSITLAVGVGIGLGLLVELMVRLLRPGVFEAGIAPWMMPMAVIFVALGQSIRMWFVRCNAFAILARIRFTTLAAPVIGQVVLGATFGGVRGLLFGFIAGHALNTILSAAYARGAVRDAFRQWTLCKSAWNS